MQKIIHGECLEIMRGMEDNSIDFIVTDSPYGISFMSKKWDKEIPPVEYWAEMLRICKPGSYIAAAGLPRMMHRLTSIIEDSGWIIKDMIIHIFGAGFPKSHNHFGPEGYGTALKPAWEGWTLAMKPLDGTYKQNVEKWGLGGINIDKCRIPSELPDGRKNHGGGTSIFKGLNLEYKHSLPNGRWPANLILDEEAAQLLDEQTGILKSGKMILKNHVSKRNVFSSFISGNSCEIESSQGGASRFFYCAKALKSERNAGLEDIESGKVTSKQVNSLKRYENGIETGDRPSEPLHKNSHPCVKPLSLMRYIITLLAPPGTPTLLDPFAGSGSTLCAAKQLGINAIGIELKKEYCEIAEARIKFYSKQSK